LLARSVCTMKIKNISKQSYILQTRVLL